MTSETVLAMHSPGPWRVETEGGDKYLKDATGHELMCDMTYYPWVPEISADWHLMASAPEMLAALKDCREALRRADATGELAVVDAAIAKAEGTR